MANWAYIIGGIILIAVGTIAMTVGSMRKSKVDADEAGQAAERQFKELSAKVDHIAVLPANQVTTKMVTDVRDEFQQWATSLRTNAGSKRLGFEKTVLAAKEAQLKASGEFRGMYERFLLSLAGRVKSCQQAGFQGLSVDSVPLPENLFLVDKDQPVLRIILADQTSWSVVIWPNLDDPTCPPPALMAFFDPDVTVPKRAGFISLKDYMSVSLTSLTHRVVFTPYGKLAYVMGDLLA